MKSKCQAIGNKRERQEMYDFDISCLFMINQRFCFKNTRCFHIFFSFYCYLFFENKKGEVDCMRKKVVFTLLFSSLILQGCSSRQAKTDVTENSTENHSVREKDYGLTDYSKLKTKPINQEKLNKELNKLKEQAEQCKTYEDYRKWQDSLNKINQPILHNMNLLDVKMYTNLNDHTSSEKFSEMMSLLNQIDVETQSLYRIHFGKDYGYKVKKELASDNPLLLREIKQTDSKEKQEKLLELKDQLGMFKNEYLQKSQSQETTFKGKDYTLSQLENESQKEAIEQKYYQELLNSYKKQISVEKELASMLGYSSVPEMYHEEYHRPYKQEEVEQMFKYVKQYFVPILPNLVQVETESKLNMPIKKVAEEDIGGPFKQINQELYDVWRLMLKNNLYDIAPNENKPENWAAVSGVAPPFLIGNLKNNSDSLQTFIHEFGHFFAIALRPKDAVQNNDVEEIYSQSLELLMTYKLSEIDPNANRTFMNRTLSNQLIAMSFLQEFQTRVYEEEELTLEKMKEIDQKLNLEYFNDNSKVSSYSWAQNITADRPLSTIEYFLGAIISLQLHEAAKEDYQLAVNQFMAMIKNPSQFSPAKIATENGLKDPKKEQTVKEVATYLSTFFKENEKL